MKNYYNYLYTKKLNLDLIKIQQSSRKMKDLIVQKFCTKNDTSYGGQATMTTGLYEQYNVLLYPFPEFYSLYKQIKQTFYEIVNPKEPHYIHCWLNYYMQGEYIDWHEHWPAGMGVWHGFYCADVETEKSFTSYKLPFLEKEINIESENNLLVIGKSEEDKHRSSEWNSTEPRITIAFDVVPAKHINPYYWTNHWIPV